jgi:hypothetical protein
MNRPTFVTMSTLAATLVAYFALTQTAHADAAIDPRGLSPEAVGTALRVLPLSSKHSGASLRR